MTCNYFNVQKQIDGFCRLYYNVNQNTIQRKFCLVDYAIYVFI